MNKTLLISHLISLWIVTVIVFLLAGVVFLILNKLKKAAGCKKIMVIVGIIICLFNLCHTVLCTIDIVENSFVTEEAHIEKISNAKIIQIIVLTKKDGSRVDIYDFSSLPLGTYDGIVTYSKHSRILISFEIN